MSLQVPQQGLGLPWPEKPMEVPAVRNLELAADWINENLPFVQDSRIYRPEMAWLSGGNCYAQALGCIALLEEWEIPAGIVLDNQHAEVVADTPVGVFFVDPMFPEIRKPHREDSRHSGFGLGNLYSDLLPQMLRDGDFVTYFYREHPDTGNEDWRAIQTSAIRGQTDIVPYENAHIIVDGRQGKDMLLAIGDLSRYSMTKPDKYVDEYHNLAQYVPDFIDLPPPWHHNEREAL